MEKQVYQGKFWIPESPEKAVSGTLTIGSNLSIQLKIIDFSGPNTPLTTFYNDYQKRTLVRVIFDLHGGKVGILINVRMSGFQIGNSPSITYKSEYLMYSDLSCVDNQVLKFKKAKFRFPFIEDIFFLDPIQIQFNETSLTLTANRMESIEIICNNDISVYIDYGVDLHHNSVDHATMDKKTYIRIESKIAIGFEELITFYISRLSHLVSLISGKYAIPIDILLFTNHNDERDKTPIEVLYTYFNKNIDESYQGYGFTQADLKRLLSCCLNSYFDFCKSGSLIMNTYISGLFRNKSTLEILFIATTSSLEAIIRDFTENTTYLARADFKKHFLNIINPVLAQLDEHVLGSDFLKRAEGCITCINNYSFKSLIELAVNKHKAILDQLFSEEHSTLIDEIDTMRNKIVHVKKHRHNELMNYTKLIQVWKVAQVIFEVFLYKHLGIPDELVLIIMRNVHDGTVKQSWDTGIE